MSRPGVLRWIAALGLAVLVSPLVSPFSWFLLIVEGIDLAALAFIMFGTYVVGVPVAIVGLLPIFIVWLVWFERVSTFPWWWWGLLGAAIGLGLVTLLSWPDLAQPSYEVPTILMLLTGLTCGAVGALVFRAVLLR